MQLAAFGGQAGIRSENFLQSALGMPEQSFGGDYLHAYPFGMAAAYAFHLAENQPFIDGNKRTALHAAIEFLKLNGYDINDLSNKLYGAMIDMANRKMTKEELAGLLQKLATNIT
jgi:death-on-curing protein